MCIGCTTRSRPQTLPFIDSFWSVCSCQEVPPVSLQAPTARVPPVWQQELQPQLIADGGATFLLSQVVSLPGSSSSLASSYAFWSVPLLLLKCGCADLLMLRLEVAWYCAHSSSSSFRVRSFLHCSLVCSLRTAGDFLSWAHS